VGHKAEHFVVLRLGLGSQGGQHAQTQQAGGGKQYTSLHDQISKIGTVEKS
jgi:hypothetical protein